MRPKKENKSIYNTPMFLYNFEQKNKFNVQMKHDPLNHLRKV